jgi:hypothetical protein
MYGPASCEAEILERDRDLGQCDSKVVAVDACPERLRGVSLKHSTSRMD